MKLSQHTITTSSHVTPDDDEALERICETIANIMDDAQAYIQARITNHPVLRGLSISVHMQD